jgi:hypothetical protein
MRERMRRPRQELRHGLARETPGEKTSRDRLSVAGLDRAPTCLHGGGLLTTRFAGLHVP